MNGQGWAVYDDRPSRYKESSKRRTAKANQVMKSKAYQKLIKSVSNLYFFTLTAKDLGIHEKFSYPSGLYDEDIILIWREALQEAFKGCFYFALEVGKGDYKAPERGRIHVHVIADRDDGPQHLERDTKKCQRVYDLKELLRYFNKPQESYKLEAVMDYTAAKLKKDSRRAPRTRGWQVNQRRIKWNHKDASQCPIGPSIDIQSLSTDFHPGKETMKVFRKALSNPYTIQPKNVRCPRCIKTLEPDRWNIAVCIPCRVRIQIKQ